MVKSCAEIQRADRKRHKAKRGHESLKQEAKKLKRYYILTADMSKKGSFTNRERELAKL